jgi:signal transduction histidine kinase
VVLSRSPGTVLSVAGGPHARVATDQIDWLACMDTCQAGAETGGAAMKTRRRKATKLRPRKGVTAAHLTIENARLSNELRQRTDDLAGVQARTVQLSRSVEELRALCEVSQAVNSTLDIETVLATIVSKAVQLSMTDGGAIYVFDEESQEFQLRATHGMDAAMIAAVRDQRVRPDEAIVAQATGKRGPVQVPELLDEPSSPLLEIVIRAGYRAVLVVPLLRPREIIGLLVVRRKQPGEFSKSTIDLLGTFADQSALAIQNARLFRDIEEKSKQLEQASQHKSQFLANMSHELRTPLNAIIGFTEILREDARDLKREDELEPLDRVLSAGRHLLALINDILDLTKIETGRMELHLESFPLGPLIEGVAQAIEPMASKNGNRLIVDCPAGLGIVHADQTRLRQVLLNIANNASKFTEQGRIIISAQPQRIDERDWIIIGVTDTGIGMTEEQIGRLFQQFFQADTSFTRKYGGAGLGLAISRHFCLMMGGDISIVSEPSKGSTFTIRLPKIVDAPAVASAHTGEAALKPH